MRWLIGKLLSWSIGDVDARIFSSELDESYCRLLAVEGRTTANRWRRKEVLRAVFLAIALRSSKNSRHGSRGMGHGALWQDLRFSLRSFARKPAFFSVVLLLFTLGIGANTVIFSVVDGVVLRPLPYLESDRLITTYQTIPDWLESDNPGLRAAWNRLQMSYPVYEDWLEKNDVFDAFGIYARKTYVASGGDQAEWITGRSMTHGVFSALGVRPILGRVLVPEDDAVGGLKLVVLSFGLWKRRFGADSSVIGQTMILDEQQYEVVGVMPEDFYFPDSAEGELWTTFSDRDRQRGRTNQFAGGIARLKMGVSLELAQQEIEIIQDRLEELYPHEEPGRAYGVRLLPYKEDVVGDVRPALLLLLSAVGVVLLISCVNIANLLLIKTSERRRELAVRSSIGAGRWRLLRQLLTESLALSSAGGVLGTVLAIVSIGPFLSLLPPGTPRVSEIGVDLRVLTFAAGLTVFTGLMVGLLPALTVLRAPLNVVLQDSGRGALGGRNRNRTQATLLVLEVALTFVLLVGAGLLTRSFVRLTSVERGFVANAVLTMRIDPRGSRYVSEEHVRAIYGDLDEALEAVPGVTLVAASAVGPFLGDWSNSAVVEAEAGEVETNLYRNEVADSYFDVLEIPLRGGRLFTQEEEADGSMVAVVSAGLERTYWPREGAIGKRVRFGKFQYTDNPWFTIVGVVGDVRRRLEAEPYPTVYTPITDNRRHVLLKTAIPPSVVIADVRLAVESIDPNLPVAELHTLEQRISESVAGPRVRFLLMSCLAGVAAVLAVVGIFGVLAYAVAQRTNEIGIRMALGAATGDVIRSVLNRGLALLMLGLAIGLTVSLLTVHALEGFLFEISPMDPATLIAVTLLLATAALAASYLPARRAAKVDPVEALRRE
ncbi:ABC transporter permease [Gemmatimonadota bacterium]